VLLQRTNVEDSKSHQGAPVATAVERRRIDQFGSARKVHCVRHPAQKGCQRTVPAGFVGGAGVTPVATVGRAAATRPGELDVGDRGGEAPWQRTQPRITMPEVRQQLWKSSRSVSIAPCSHAT